jgi:hypothetical protein
MLLTDDYREQQAALHAVGNYGTAALQWGSAVSGIVDKIKAETLLDYGCGSKCSLAEVLDCDVLYQGYDPAVPKLAREPDAADVVACIDVLEHIEPECLDAVIEHLKSKVKRVLFVTVHTGPAKKVLPDGRNAHLIQKGAQWWLPKLHCGLELMQFQAYPMGFWAVLRTDKWQSPPTAS